MHKNIWKLDFFASDGNERESKQIYACDSVWKINLVGEVNFEKKQKFSQKFQCKWNVVLPYVSSCRNLNRQWSFTLKKIGCRKEHLLGFGARIVNRTSYLTQTSQDSMSIDADAVIGSIITTEAADNIKLQMLTANTISLCNLNYLFV